jgi:signal transduction histidine kinase
MSFLVQSAIAADSRLDRVYLASVETSSHRKIVVVDKDTVGSDTSLLAPFVPRRLKRQTGFDDLIHRGIPPNSWEYIPTLVETIATHSFEAPFRPDSKLSQLADDLRELGDSRNLQRLITTLDSPRVELSEWHVFALVRASAAVERPDLVEAAYALLPSPEEVSPYLLSAVLSARSLAGRLTEGLEEFERFARRDNPLDYINSRVCGQALNLATRSGLRENALDILGFMKAHDLQITAIDLTVVVKNLTDSTSMLELAQQFLPVTTTVDSHIFLPILKRVGREFERLHQHAVRYGGIVSGLGRLRESVDKCLDLMSEYDCKLNRYLYPAIIRLYSDLDEPIKAYKYFMDSQWSGELQDSGILEILSGVYHPSARPFLLEVGRYGISQRQLHLPVHEVLDDVQRLSFQGALRPRRTPPSKEDYIKTLNAFSDQLDLLEALRILIPQYATKTLVRMFSLTSERDHEASSRIFIDIMKQSDLENNLDQNELLMVSQSIARVARYELMEQWITRLRQANQLRPTHLTEVINCAVAEAKRRNLSLAECSALLGRPEKLIDEVANRLTGSPAENLDRQRVVIQLMRAFSVVGDNESVLRLERELQKEGVDTRAVGLGLVSDVLLSSSTNQEDNRQSLNSWSDVTVILEDVVHEMNQPLFGAANALKVLRKRLIGGASPDQILEPLSRLEVHLQRLSERVYEYAVSAQVSEASKMSSDIESVILGVLHKYETSILALGVRVNRSRVAAESRTAPMSSVLLRIVLDNAIRNSLDAFENSGTSNPEIRIAFGREASPSSAQKRYYITIEDNGPGISQEILETVWNRGVTTKGERGLGLGLPLLRTVINRLDGDIRIVSPLPGGASGTRLIVRL